MSYAKLDDRANEHHKMLAAGGEACWLWACGLMYANRQPARDGFIPDLALGMLYPYKSPKKLADRLVEVGLWEREDRGYRIHDYHSLNPTRQQYEEYLAKARSRSAKNYEASKDKKLNSSCEETQNNEEKNSDSSGLERSSVGSDLDLTRDPGEPPEPSEKQLEAAYIREVFEFWRTDTGHQDARLTDGKAKFIRGRRRDGFTVDQLKQAIQNRRLNAHYMGQNDTGTVYDGVDNLLRNAERVEKLLALSGRANGASSGTFAAASNPRDAEGWS